MSTPILKTFTFVPQPKTNSDPFRYSSENA